MSSLLRRIGGLLFTLFLFSPLAAVADPPARVGRLAHFEDVVQFRLQRDDVAGPATRNWPISSGAVLETGERGRAEVWVDSTALRLDGDSRVEFTTIDDERVLLDVAGGSLAVSIMDAEQAADLQLRLADGRIRFAAPGRYRLDVWSDRSELTTLAGLASIEHDGGRTQLAAGSTAMLFADGQLRIAGSERPDAFDRWVAERENATLASVSRRHVSPYMTGYQDLDAYGDWNSHQEYGSVWYPRVVAVDWAPYRFGRWAWIAPWGWTWIDAAPWGFAPFHYGRWVMIHGRWAWVPGRRLERPVYAPALVAWIGNPGWSVSFSFGAAPAVGWFPLAPREVYVPHYHHSPTYIRRLNVTHVHNVTIIERAARERHHEHFVHRASPQAVTVVPASRLREGRDINAREFRRIERHELGRVPVAAAVGGKEWLAPAPEARRPRLDDRREPLPAAGPRPGGRSERDLPDGRPERRGEPDGRRPESGLRDTSPARREAPVVRTEAAGGPAEREIRREERRDGGDERRAVWRDERRSDAPGGAEPPLRPAPQAVPERRPERSAPRELRDERHDARRDDGARSLRHAEPPQPPALPVVPERRPERSAAPVEREMQRAPREVMRPPLAPRPDDSPNFRRAEREAPSPAMRLPEPREARGGRERESAEARGRGNERGQERGGERGERGPR